MGKLDRLREDIGTTEAIPPDKRFEVPGVGRKGTHGPDLRRDLES